MITFILASVLLQGPATSASAVIEGQVRMRDGVPAAAVRVAAIPAPRENVSPADGQNYYATQTPTAVSFTDGDGRYRLAVPAGRYLVVAGLIGRGTFYRSTTEIDRAEALTVTDGRAANIDLTLQSFPGARVAGRITPPPADGVREYAALASVALGEMPEVPVREDGSFDFGRVPLGDYLLYVSPNPPGQTSLAFRVEQRDMTTLEFVRPPVRKVSGRIVVEKGPLPVVFLAFSTPQGHVSAPINPDGTFSVALHAATHRVELGGLPVGYAVRSVRMGAKDVTATGIPLAGADVENVTIDVAVRRQLAALRGRFTGSVPGAEPLRVEVTGPIVGRLEAPVRPDGSFEIPALPPGLYRVHPPGPSDARPAEVVVTSGGGEVTIEMR